MTGVKNKIDIYTIIEEIERSNYAVIYKVKDNKGSLRVLKIARANKLEFNELISREFQILSQFKHPNIVKVYDYNIDEQGRYYSVLEYVPGKAINKLFHTFSEEFIAAILQTLHGLSAFHNNGFIHCDLKPEHILYVQEEKKVVLIDFGFAGTQTELKEFAGTVGYMAPEVAAGIGVDQRSDLYSLGAIIYETLSGERVGAEYKSIKQVPYEINGMIKRLLSKEPAFRPTIPELYQILSGYFKTTRLKKIPYKVQLPQTVFVEIPDIIEKLLSTIGTAVIIIGDTGAGKTRLLHEMKYKYLMQGYSVLYYTPGKTISFLECIQNFVGGKTIDLSSKEEKFQIFEEINQNLKKFAENKTVIIMVDEMNKLSDYELALFRYIGYGIYNCNILLLGTSETSERIKQLGFPSLRLRPFSINETAQLLEKTFFSLEPTEKDIPPSRFTQWLQKQSGGAPLFIVEILKNLFEKKILSYSKNRWQIDMESLDKVKITRIENLLKSRFKTVAPNEKEILKLLSLIQHPIETNVIKEFVGDNIDVAIEHLRTAGLLQEGTKKEQRIIYIPNQILIQTISTTLTREEKNRLSRRLIKVFETTLSTTKEYIPVLTVLCDTLNDKTRTFKYAMKAAEQAAKIYDYGSALNHYRIAMKYVKSVQPDMYPEILIRIAEINQITGDGKLAADYFKEALNFKSKKYKYLGYAGLGRICSSTGKYRDAVVLLKKALKFIPDKNSEDYIKTANRLAYSLIFSNRFKEAKSILNQSLATTEKLKNKELLAETMYYQVVYEWSKEHIDKGIEKAQALLNFTKKHNLLKNYAYAANLLFMFYQHKNEKNLMTEYLDEAIKTFKKLSLTNALLSALNNKIYFYYTQFDLSKAKALSQDIFLRARQTNNSMMEIKALSILADISELKGKFDEAIELIRNSLKIKPNLPETVFTLIVIYCKKGELKPAKTLFQERFPEKDNIYYYFVAALIKRLDHKNSEAKKMLQRGVELLKSEKLVLYNRREIYLYLIGSFYELREFKKSLQYSKKLIKIAAPGSRCALLARIFTKLINYRLSNREMPDITEETEILKRAGCLYDYAYVKRLAIEVIIEKEDIDSIDLQKTVKELDEISEIFKSLNAVVELRKSQALQKQIQPIIYRDYSRKRISTEYLKVFSKLAELISLKLGEENFAEELLDLIIQATNAERGAFFLRTPTGKMEFIAGRHLDKTTIKDAGEVSKTAIKEMNKNRIVFTRDALADPDFNIRHSVKLNKIRSILCIPLAISENVVGALYLDSRFKGVLFDQEDKDFLLTVARILASVIEKSRAFQKLSEENILLKNRMVEEIGTGYLMARSKAMKNVHRMAEKIARTNSPVLILGETGSGKGMLAQFIHLKSKRKNKKFLTINCGTIPETLLESELFGHKKGAFTGAVADKKGLLEEAQGGTIFLDEITNTTPGFQAKLLEAIEDKIIRRVGETQVRKIDVRFLFATNKDIEIEVEENRFRRDLYYRINVFCIELPPLRERVNDIPVLARLFLKKFSREMNKNIKDFTPEAMQKMKEYMWPGNVRELQNVIERAVVIAKGEFITYRDIGLGKIPGIEIVPIKEIKKEAIIEALNTTEWNVKKAAEILGINRRTIQRYIKKYNIKQSS